MGIADVEQRTGCADRQIRDRAGPHVRQVHVAAVIVRRQRVDGVDLGRAAQRADVRLVGQRDTVAPVDVILVDLNLAHLLGQRLVEGRGVVGAGEPTELLDHAAGAAGWGPRGAMLSMWTASTSPFSAPAM